MDLRKVEEKEKQFLNQFLDTYVLLYRGLLSQGIYFRVMPVLTILIFVVSVFSCLLCHVIYCEYQVQGLFWINSPEDNKRDFLPKFVEL